MQLPAGSEKVVKIDTQYSNQSVKELDLGYQSWNKGIMLRSENTSFEKLTRSEKPSTIDNYIFVRKYYKNHRVYYLLVRNILNLHNPIRELYAFYKTRNVKKITLTNSYFKYNDYDKFQSELVKLSPLVSIIIPTLNRYDFLESVLNDLKVQNYENFEVIIIDQTDNPIKDFYDKFNLNLRVIYQKEKGQWLARNEAIRNAKGEYLVFFDDDSRVEADWVFQHLKGLDYFNADISAGVSNSKVGDNIPLNYSFFRWADQFDSGNALVKRKVFNEIGMFDRQFDKQRMGDGEFGLRAYLAGFKSISHPYAKRIHLKTSTGGLRQMGSWDAFRSKNFFAPRPLPSVLYFYRKYFPRNYVYNAVIIGMLPSLIPYRWKGKKYLYPFSALLAIIILPLLFLQLSVSWSRATKMLKQGDKIEWL